MLERKCCLTFEGKSVELRVYISILLAVVMVLVSTSLFFYRPIPVRKSLSLPELKESFVGREKEINIIMDYFDQSEVRIVTLFGPPGFGKSEVAVHVGHRVGWMSTTSMSEQLRILLV